MGADAFAHFTQWHEWENILKLCKLIVVNRPDTPQTKSPCHDNIQHVAITPADISSTAIRAGRLSEETLPSKTLAYIQQHNLYQA